MVEWVFHKKATIIFVLVILAIAWWSFVQDGSFLNCTYRSYALAKEKADLDARTSIAGVIFDTTRIITERIELDQKISDYNAQCGGN